jgi:hypothetical protein
MSKNSKERNFKNYPKIVKNLLLSATSLRSSNFHDQDRRFDPQSKTHSEVKRPQVFIEKMTFLEPSLFAPSSHRQWCLLLPDVDVHGWSALSSFTILCGRAEVLLKVIVVLFILLSFWFKMLEPLPVEKVPLGRAGIPYLAASRPGIPDSFVLSIAIGGVRTSNLGRAVMPEISGRWSLKLSARVMVAFFQGLVRRVSQFTKSFSIGDSLSIKSLCFRLLCSRLRRVELTAKSTSG